MTTTAEEVGGDLDSLSDPFPGMPEPPPPPPPGAPAPKPAAGSTPPPRRSRAKARKTATPPKPRQRVAGGPSRPAPAKAGADYRDGVKSLLQVAAIPLGLAAMKGDQAAAADLVTLNIHGDAIADGVQQLAEADPRVEAVVRWVAGVGPLGAALAPLLTVALQLAANHGIVPEPVAVQMGCARPSQLAAMLFEQHAGQAPGFPPAGQG